MPDQLALRGTALLRALMCGHAEVTCILLWERIIGPEIAFDLAMNGRFVAF
ncbi:hypothetical protein MUB52_21090 [Roseobacter sp. WL0113]|uniref:Uncharacterized protein n=1 Tax=Roseobacter sinensis TaxID=2931391 RepID=A0ABT3BL32_9RHOB|nr:hypothetical protein [Roseobacter sp. WL0113]MCV3273938.1 hypothetical protein [Roseobacter sp. WL0113]